MRTTLTIDDDVLAAARHISSRDNKALGEVISAWARRGLMRSQQATAASRNGIPLLLHGDTPVTPETVNQLRDELP